MSGLMYGAGSSGSGSGAKSNAAAAGEKPELGLDSAGEANFVKFFKNMSPVPDGTVRLFDRTDFYSAHGPAALLVASAVFKTHSVVKYLGAGGSKAGLPSVTLGKVAARDFLVDALTSRQLKVEIWSGGGKRSNDWSLSKQASPGNLQQVEDLLFSSSDMLASPIVLALCLVNVDGVRTVGAAFADASSRTLGVAEFADNDLFSNVESLIIQLGVKECLLQGDEKNANYDLTRLRSVVDRCGCVVTQRKKSDFTTKNIEQDLLRLLADTSAGSAQPEFSLKGAMSACAALLAYLELLADAHNFGQYSIRIHDLAQYLRLDASALRALSIFPEPGAMGGNKSMSLYGLLNHCKTAQGQRMLAQWLKQPLVNVHEIRKRLTLVETFAEDISARQAIQTDCLKLMPDMHRISKRFQKGVATLEDVVRVYQAILRLPQLVQTLEDTQTDDEEARTLLNETLLDPIREADGNLAKLAEMVEATLDLDELQNHNYSIKPDFDEKLMRIKAKLDDVRDRLDAEHHRVGKDLGMELDKKLHLENHSSYGYCFRLSRADAKVLNSKSAYRELATIKSGVHFVSTELKELGEDFRTLSDDYARQQVGLVKDVIGIAASYCPPLEQLNVLLATLDVLVSFAHVSMCAPTPYTRPVLGEKGTAAPLILTESRHACLEVQEDISFIANDASMERERSEFVIITGPNMGGKSTYIRQIGIIALLAQVGCFVPAAEGAQLPVFDCILARVGAGDSQLKGVSTFMSEMLETATILKTATQDSLIIVDELGRGTSTYDGFGLAWAISESIATQIRCKTLFASHFAEITNLAEQQAHVTNLHVVAHVSERRAAGKEAAVAQDITLLYKVEPGIGDRSYGIHVAELAAFPESVIKLAKRKAEELEDFEDEGAAPLLKMPTDVTEAGTALVQEFMRVWAARSDALKADAATKKRKVAPRQELDTLRRTVEEFRERCEGNEWVATVLASF